MPILVTPHFTDAQEFKTWFESHISTGGKPYTLDLNQAGAVFDNHKNTLVTARAGSGKTRVIVAKVAYLIATGQAKPWEIAAFMFNRTAAAEVNERIGTVKIDGVQIKDWQGNTQPIRIASTFHKFALDTVKLSGERPQLISETEHNQLITTAFHEVTTKQEQKLSPQEHLEMLRLAGSFISRAGQKYLGASGLNNLCAEVQSYIAKHQSDPSYTYNIYLHKLCLATYQEYLSSLNGPRLDFNILMARAIQILGSQCEPKVVTKTSRYKYIMVDEYQDFSYLFFSMIQATRQNCPGAHLFAVGDDWQAINRFAGSDVSYFIDFAKFFPEDTTNINLTTNYRSDRRIVENANYYMLTNYNSAATKAVPFSKKPGKIKRLKLQKVKFDGQDLSEDALGDARFQLALASTCGGRPQDYKEAARLLKLTFRLVKKHRRKEILLLHRHNFTSFTGVTLDGFYQALRRVVIAENVISKANFDQQVRILTMHRSKGLESAIVIILETNRDQVLANHPHATIFELFGDTLVAEKADQQRLLYVAMTRAKHRLYLVTSDRKCPI